MSERSIQIDGVTYLRSRDAARIVNLAPDYISRLARSGDIDGHRVENLWFVNLNSINDFLADQQLQKERWYAELARQRREEQIRAGQVYSPGGSADGTASGQGILINKTGWGSSQGLWKIVSGNSTKRLDFYANTAAAGDFSTNNIPLTLQYDGNVGIGTTTRSTALTFRGVPARYPCVLYAQSEISPSTPPVRCSSTMQLYPNQLRTSSCDECQTINRQSSWPLANSEWCG